MSDEDRDVDIESDDDDYGLPSPPGSSGLGKNGAQFHSQADKRAHHNALERKRRDHIKDSFSSLRDSVPALQGEKASRAQILKKAAEYIQFMRRKNTSHQQDIDDLKKQNKILEEQTVRAMEKAKTTGSFASSAMLETSNHVNSRGDAISAFDGGSGSESSDLDDDDDDLPQPLPPSRKKLKTSPGTTPMRI